MGKLYKRGETYWADYVNSRNQRVRHTLRTNDRTVAKARLREAELGTTDAGEAPPQYLAAAIDAAAATKRALTATAYKHKGLHLCEFFGDDYDLNKLIRTEVVEYIKQRRTDGVIPHTIQKELVVLRQALKEVGLSAAVVPQFHAEYEPATRWLTPDEFKLLLGAVAPKHRTWLLVQVYTGAELSAMRRLSWAHVNLERGTITIPGTKKSSRYRVDMPLPGPLLEWLRKQCRTEPLIAPWPCVHKDLRAACDAAGIKPRASTHDLRRTFGSWLVQGGVDIHHVARLMGNTYNMVARVYGQTSDASYAAAMSKLPSLDEHKPDKPKPKRRK